MFIFPHILLFLPGEKVSVLSLSMCTGDDGRVSLGTRTCSLVPRMVEDTARSLGSQEERSPLLLGACKALSSLARMLAR